MMAFNMFPMAPDITWGHIMPCEPKQAGEFHCLPMSLPFSTPHVALKHKMISSATNFQSLFCFTLVALQSLNAPDSEDTSPAAGT